MNEENKANECNTITISSAPPANKSEGDNKNPKLLEFVRDQANPSLLRTLQNIESMKHSQYWTNDFSWYGPSGIGSSKGMEGFRKFHQIPFLRGFPDRKGASHYIRIADNNFVVTGGWPSVQATHLGEWLGMPATNKKIYMRVMDFYRIENEKIAENWVPIDIIHILYQMGFDVFKRFNK